MAKLEDDLKHIRTKAEEADKQYDEVSKKLQVGPGLTLLRKLQVYVTESSLSLSSSSSSTSSSSSSS